MDDVTFGRNGREAQKVEADACSDCHEGRGDTRLESGVNECLFVQILDRNSARLGGLHLNYAHA